MLFKIIKENEISFYEPSDLDAEKIIQRLTENNLKQIFGFEFLSTEFSVDTFGGGTKRNYRFDTVAYDGENNSFIIIEYKNVKNSSLMDQGFAYLSVLKQRKEIFVLLFNHVMKQNKGVEDFDWTQTRVVFVSPSFTDFQIDSTSFKGLPFILYKFKAYKDGTIELDQVKNQINEKLDATSIESDFAEVQKEVVVYTEDALLDGVSTNIVDLYNDLKDRVALKWDLDIVPKKLYVAFKSIKNIFDVQFTKNAMDVYINVKKGKLKDEHSITEDISGIGHQANGDYRVRLKDDTMLNYVVDVLIKQSYEINH